MTDEIRILGYTTKDISSSGYAHAFAALLADHIGSVEALVLRSGLENWVKFENLEEGDFAEADMSESFALRAIRTDNGIDVRSSFHWKKFDTQNAFDKSVEVAGFMQNSISLIVALSAAPTARVQTSLLGFIVAVANLFEVNFLYAVDYRGCEFDHRFDTASGLGVGLKDIYPINYFGPAFTSLIGIDRLLQLPAEVIEQHGDSVLIAPLRNFVTYGLQQFEHARAQIREEIGAQFFAAYMEPPESGVGCILALPFVLWKESRRFRDERGRAKRRPVFDWSDMIGGE